MRMDMVSSLFIRPSAGASGQFSRWGSSSILIIEFFRFETFSIQNENDAPDK